MQNNLINIIVYSCFHPTKLNEECWFSREVEYFYSLNSIINCRSKQELIVIDNSIDSIDEILFPPLASLLRETFSDLQIEKINLLCSKTLYSSNDQMGLKNMLKGWQSLFAEHDQYLIINGRQFFLGDKVFQDFISMSHKPVILWSKDQKINNNVVGVRGDKIKKYGFDVDNIINNLDAEDHHIFCNGMSMLRLEYEGSQIVDYGKF